jgi:two-component system, sensor histidine kinase and response regulator
MSVALAKRSTSDQDRSTNGSPMKRILVIEDNHRLRREIVTVLELHGFEVDAAPNGRVGLERIRASRPSLVICDLMMPELDGYETLKMVRANPETEALPFVILTARDERQQMRQGMELGADDYVIKPFKFDDLVKAVNAAFEKHARVSRQADKKLEKLREDVAAALPHELRTPLACIMGYAEMLADGGSMAPQDVTALAQQILGAGQRLHRMSENALLYVQLELLRNGRGNLHAGGAATTSLDEIVARQARAVAAKHGRDADLRLLLKPAAVAVSQTYVAKIVDELVDNAFKFSSRQQPVRLSTAVEGSHATFRVADAGAGMSPEQIDAIGGFVQFERSVREQHGVGLGLSIVKRVATLWGGTMTVQSARGTGTTVTISLPVANTASVRPPAAGSAAS